MRCVLTAAYGMGNIGDEAICSMLMRHLREIEPTLDLTVLAWDTKRWHQAHPNAECKFLPAFFILPQLKSPRVCFGILRSLWAIFRSDVVVLGGGGLIRNRDYWLRAYLYPIRIAQLFKKKVAVYGVGVDELTVPEVIKLISPLKNARLSTRDPESAQHLAKALDVPLENVDVVLDSALSYPTLLLKSPVSPVLGINLCNINGTSSASADMQILLQALANQLEKLAQEHDFTVRLLPSTVQDQKFAEQFIQLSPVPTQICIATTPEEYMQNMQTCNGCIVMRLHAALLASRITGLPMIGIEYAQKVRQAFMEVGADAHLFSWSDVASQKFLNTLRALITAKKPVLAWNILKEKRKQPSDWLRTALLAD